MKNDTEAFKLLSICWIQAAKTNAEFMRRLMKVFNAKVISFEETLNLMNSYNENDSTK